MNTKLDAEKLKKRKSDAPNSMTPIMSLNLPRNRNMTLTDGNLLMVAGGSKIAKVERGKS